MARGLAARMRTPTRYLPKDLCASGAGDELTLAVPCPVATCVFDVVNFIRAEVVNFW